MEPQHFPIEHVDELRAKGVHIVDVREPKEWESGMLPDAGRAPLSALRTGELGDIANYAMDEPVALYCKGGVRSEEAARIAIANGYSNVYTLDGGILAWPGRQ